MVLLCDGKLSHLSLIRINQIFISNIF